MCKIVIIEDDIDICNMIKKFLENNKYSVQYALNGIERYDCFTKSGSAKNTERYSE